MSILSAVTSILECKDSGIGAHARNASHKPTTAATTTHSKWNDDHKGRDDTRKTATRTDYSKLSGKDDYSK